MKLTEICRETTSVIDFTEPMSTLAQEAEEVLGYSRLKQEKDDPAVTGMKAKLAALQIETLKASDVEQYKSEQLIERTKEKLAKWITEGATGTFYGPSWNRVDISKYNEPIPEFVLNKAIQIKREIPGVVIQIDSLEDYPDPFLVVSVKHPRYSNLTEDDTYVEVWAEPKFEGRIR